MNCIVRTTWALAVAGLTSACAADLGAGGGLEARSGNAVGYGRLAAHTKFPLPLNSHGVMVGASLESRAEQDVGTRYDLGVMAGGGFSPAAIPGGGPTSSSRLGLEWFLEGGSPIRAGLFHHWSFFAGAGFAAPLYFGPLRDVTDLNNSIWIARSRFELVPMTRVRVHVDEPAVDATTRVDLTLGLACRLRVLSDVF